MIIKFLLNNIVIFKKKQSMITDICSSNIQNRTQLESFVIISIPNQFVNAK